MAVMAPSPGGVASCICLPRSYTMRTAAAKSKAPAAVSAEYSPKLCPATIAGRGPPSDTQASCSATLTTSIAGCVICVRFSSSSGPSRTMRRRSKPNASAASA